MLYKDMGLELLENNYNVSILIPEDSKFRHFYEETDIKMIHLPGVTQYDLDIIERHQNEGKDSIKDVFELCSNLLKPTKNDATWIPFLKSQ